MVLASLNSARAKGTEAAIKSNLKNMIPEAELAYDTAGNYSTACAAIAKMLTAITNAGGTATCYTYDNTRWGVSTKLNSDSTKNWSVDGNGVVAWDTANTGVIQTWTAASTACASGRLPSFEEAKALYDAYSGRPTGFTADYYWSGTADPSNSANAYNVNMSDGSVRNSPKTWNGYVRCVH